VWIGDWGLRIDLELADGGLGIDWRFHDLVFSNRHQSAIANKSTIAIKSVIANKSAIDIRQATINRQSPVDQSTMRDS
jgi:hypothetical protein